MLKLEHANCGFAQSSCSNMSLRTLRALRNKTPAVAGRAGRDTRENKPRAKLDCFQTGANVQQSAHMHRAQAATGSTHMHTSLRTKKCRQTWKACSERTSKQVSTPADRQVPLRWTRPLHLFWLPRYQLLGMGTCPLPCRVKFPPGHWAEIKMPSAAYTRMFSRIPLWRGRAGAKYFWHFVRYLNNQAAVAPEKRRHASHKLQIRPLLFKV